MDLSRRSCRGSASWGLLRWIVWRWICHGVTAGRVTELLSRLNDAMTAPHSQSTTCVIGNSRVRERQYHSGGRRLRTSGRAHLARTPRRQLPAARYLSHCAARSALAALGHPQYSPHPPSSNPPARTRRSSPPPLAGLPRATNARATNTSANRRAVEDMRRPPPRTSAGVRSRRDPARSRLDRRGAQAAESGGGETVGRRRDRLSPRSSGTIPTRQPVVPNDRTRGGPLPRTRHLGHPTSPRTRPSVADSFPPNPQVRAGRSRLPLPRLGSSLPAWTIKRDRDNTRIRLRSVTQADPWSFPANGPTSRPTRLRLRSGRCALGRPNPGERPTPCRRRPPRCGSRRRSRPRRCLQWTRR